MAEHLQLINPGSVPPPAGMVMTETASNILRSLRLVADEPGTLTMVAGVPGVGKSETLRRYTHESKNAQMFTMVAGEGRIWDLANVMMERLELGAPNSRRLREDRYRIMDAIGAEQVVIFDEAQYLANYNPRGGFNFDAYEWVRAMAEEACFSVVFCGDLSLADTISSVPQLRRRMVRPVVIRSVPKPDVLAVVRSRGITDPAICDALSVMARRYGGLADVQRTLAQAAKHASSDKIAASDVKAAMLYLGLSGQGGF
ncbi:hypothetical protein Dshi_0099 [Dinoroseobacter shibae DFL 12 = DSM 16493]|jgi:DNA transposition AAA+ family ATPase|uniref:AAA+ ATPase domain-containing protein n=1 Tax=Dinoroseobacter shibae (strain DSM 16493 / NCIMB 14021 / DFL 12) TaxID=398580 RepID=A8LKK5_DINSH|nr:AAA family ATPase [Dinoroseobacter shibae]ABV91848.1 hypothetical protein Dshi_0099 [Dinoroseobacter shibae DFL 12 = DSM 16493]URF46826.1 AAA family ATPase [Dinoroseobacter shibae]URF51137.1 AAA family ATPase [Dinoroseobacter shibae]